MNEKWVVSRRWVAFLALLFLAACHSGPTEEGGAAVRTDSPGIHPGVLKHYFSAVDIAVPTRVTAGVPFRVQVKTYGGWCVAKGHMEVSVVGSIVHLRPYDIVAELKPDEICPAIMIIHTHEAVLTFPNAGNATVLITGREKPGDHSLTAGGKVQVVTR